MHKCLSRVELHFYIVYIAAFCSVLFLFLNKQHKGLLSSYYVWKKKPSDYVVWLLPQLGGCVSLTHSYLPSLVSVTLFPFQENGDSFSHLPERSEDI